MPTHKNEYTIAEGFMLKDILTVVTKFKVLK